MLIVDLQHWLHPNGELLEAATMGLFAAEVVECATAVDNSGLTSMPCRARRCAGCLLITRSSDRIDWRCILCEQTGVISGWEGTRWDLSKVAVGPDGDDVTTYLPLNELAALRKLHGMPPGLRAALAGASLIEDRACVVVTVAEAELLLEALEKQGSRKQALQRAHGRLDQMLISDRLHRIPRDAAIH